MTEHHVDPVQVWSRLSGQEELRAVGVLPAVGHRQQERPVVLQVKVFIVEGAAVNGLSAGAISCREVAALDHEVADHPVQLDTLVVQRFLRLLAETLLSRAESSEVLCSARTYVAEEFKDNSAQRHSIQLQIEEAARVSCRLHRHHADTIVAPVLSRTVL